MTFTAGRMPLGKMLAVFLAVLIAGSLVLGGLSYLFPDLPVPSSIGIVLAMVGAMSAGQSGAKASGRTLVFGEKAIFAVLATLLSLALGIGFLWAMFAYFGVPFTLENVTLIMTENAVPTAEITKIMVWVVPIVLALCLAITYFGVALGSRNHFKLQEKLAARGK